MGALGIEGSYVAVRIDPGELPSVVDKIRAGELDGVNVTMPHKRAAADLVDELTPDARESHSVNTIVREEDGRLTGHSTDISALRRLWNAKPMPNGRPVLVLGAGGAAAAACLAAPVAVVYVSARRPEAVASLAGDLERAVVGIPWRAAVADAVIINATALGMEGEELPDRVVRLASGLVDMAYGQIDKAYGAPTTPAIATAQKLGIPTVDGLELLVAQAGDSFRLWTGHEPPWEAMVAAARNHSRPPGG